MFLTRQCLKWATYVEKIHTILVEISLSLLAKDRQTIADVPSAPGNKENYWKSDIARAAFPQPWQPVAS